MTIKELKLALSLFAEDSNEDNKIVLMVNGQEVQIESVYLNTEEEKIELWGK